MLEAGIMAPDGIRLAMAANIPEGADHPTKVATTKTQRPVTTTVGTSRHVRKLIIGWRLLLFPMFLNMLVCAYSGHVGWMLFWAIAFSGGVHEYGYEYGKIEERLSSQSLNMETV